MPIFMYLPAIDNIGIQPPADAGRGAPSVPVGEVVMTKDSDVMDPGEDNGLVTNWMGGDGLSPGELQEFNYTKRNDATTPAVDAFTFTDYKPTESLSTDGAPGEDVMCQNNLRIGDDFSFTDYKPTESLKADDNWLAEDHQSNPNETVVQGVDLLV